MSGAGRTFWAGNRTEYSPDRTRAQGEIVGDSDARGRRRPGDIIRRNARSLPSLALAKVFAQILQVSSQAVPSTETDSASRYSAPQCGHVTSDIFMGLHEGWRSRRVDSYRNYDGCTNVLIEQAIKIFYPLWALLWGANLFKCAKL